MGRKCSPSEVKANSGQFMRVIRSPFRVCLVVGTASDSIDFIEFVIDLMRF